MNNKKKLIIIKTLLKNNNLDGYLIPSFDEFQNEFSPNCLNRLKWLSGFTGSNGLILITLSKTYFLTDGRYITQAKNQLISDYSVHDIQTFHQTFFDCNIIKLVIGYDPMIFTKRYILYFHQYCLLNEKKVEIKPIRHNIVDLIWKRKIEFSTITPFSVDLKYTYESVAEKLQKVLKSFDTDYIFITSSENICWLLNTRGCDLEYTPLFLAYCLIKHNGDIEIFSNIKKITNNYKKIKLFEFDQIQTRLRQINKEQQTIQCDDFTTPYWLFQNFESGRIKVKKDPCFILKAVKNKVEIAGFRYAMLQDGIALTKLFSWLQLQIILRNKVNEIDICIKLEEFKRNSKLYRGKSFETISAVGKNSSIIHYSPYHNNDNLYLSLDNWFLLDCGSQYEFGTTDVTRTFFFGTPKEEHKLSYTLVLKGFINLHTLKFPKGTNGSQIDVVARQFLWEHGLDYPHGTGHGVGHYLSVHEGPHAISKHNNQELLQNMVLTIEPGYYVPGKYGIRIENMVVVKESSLDNSFLEFENLTLSPISYNLIDTNMLTHNEKLWLASYHQVLQKKLNPYLDENCRAYLMEHTFFYNELI